MRRARLLPLAAAGALLLALGACSLAGPPHLDPAGVRWARVALPSLGITLSCPDVYVMGADQGGYVPFRLGRFTPLIVRWVDEADGRRRGLWFGHAISGAIRMAGVDGVSITYTHYDGPFGARMVAWVIPWRGKYLGVEIRTNGELDAVQERILASVSPL